LELLRECLHLAPDERWTIIRAWVLASLLPYGHVPPLLVEDAGALRTSALVQLLAYLMDPWQASSPQAESRACWPEGTSNRFVQVVDLSSDDMSNLRIAPFPFWEATGQPVGDSSVRRIVVTDSSDSALPASVRRHSLHVRPRWNVSTVAEAPARHHSGSFFAAVHGSILGAVLDATVEALRGYGQVDVPPSYRGTPWEPFVRWVHAAEEEIGGPAPRLVDVLAGRTNTGYRGLLRYVVALRR
jgi:hypothetical protein